MDISENLFNTISSLKMTPLRFKKTLSYDATILSNVYTTRLDCYNTAFSLIEQIHSYANAYFNPKSKKSLAKKCAKHYSKVITSFFSDILLELEDLYKSSDKQDKFKKLKNLVNNSKHNLKKAYDKELIEDAEFYELYDIDYFMELVEIAGNDNNICNDEKYIGHIVNVLLSKQGEYKIVDLNCSVNEMTADLTDHATTFYKYAHREYLRYIEKIEKALNELIQQEAKN